MTQHLIRKFCLLAACFCCASLAMAGVSLSASKGESFAGMLKSVLPSVVNIVVETKPEAMASPDADQPPQGKQRSQSGQGLRMAPRMGVGSGVIVDAEKGYILTNAHMVAGAKKIVVNLSNRHRYTAKLIGMDRLSDIAVIRIHASGLKAIDFGDSNKIQVGDVVVAIGNPFGLTQTVTSGIISALQRTGLELAGPQDYEDFIQTDASINPGNSGGALVNTDGRLIGINTAILSGQNGGNIGIGFAIPVNMARQVMEQLIAHGKLHRGIMGLMVQDLLPDVAAALHADDVKGAVVTEVSPLTPAAEAGLQVGDIITKVNDTPVQDSFVVRNAAGLLPVGTSITVHVVRKGEPLTFHLKTVDPNRLAAKSAAVDPFLFGVAFEDFSRTIPVQGRIQGALIVNLSESTAAWRAGLIPGDVITSANGEKVKDTAALQAIAKADKSPSLLLTIARGQGALFIVVKRTDTGEL